MFYILLGVQVDRVLCSSFLGYAAHDLLSYEGLCDITQKGTTLFPKKELFIIIYDPKKLHNEIGVSKDQHPPTTLQGTQIPSNRDHKALNRGILGGLGRDIGPWDEVWWRTNPLSYGGL